MECDRRDAVLATSSNTGGSTAERRHIPLAATSRGHCTAAPFCDQNRTNQTSLDDGMARHVMVQETNVSAEHPVKLPD